MATSVVDQGGSGEIFMLADEFAKEDPRISKLRERSIGNTGSVTSRYSVVRGGLAGDEELSMSLYEINKNGGSKRYSQKSDIKHSTAISPLLETSLDDGDFNSLDSSSKQRKMESSTTSVKKAGSFQMKSSNPMFSGSANESKTNGTVEGESYSRIYKAKVTTTKSTTSERSTFTKTVTQNNVTSNKSQEKSLPLKIATSGNTITTKKEIVVNGSASPELKVSNETKSTSPINEKLNDRNGGGKTVKVEQTTSRGAVVQKQSSAKESSSATNSFTSLNSISSMNSTVSSVPTVAAEKEYKMTTHTSSKLVAHSSPGHTVNGAESTKSISKQDIDPANSIRPIDSISNQRSNTSTMTSVTKLSETSSIVQNKDFKSRMNQLIATNTSSLDRRPKAGKLEIHSSTETYESKSLPRTMTSEEKEESKLIKSTPTSPIYEMKETIASGTVSSLARSGMFKHLTGRMMDPSTMERKKQKSSLGDASVTSPTSPGEKKYKFVVEGIDVPATEKTDDEEEPFTPITPLSLGDNGVPLPPPPPPPPPGTEEESKKQKMAKRGFSYVIDDKLASEIVKKAGDVTSRKAYEAVEDKVNTTSNRKSTTEEYELFLDAKAKLNKRDSYLDSDENLSPTKQKEEDPLLKEIKSKFDQRRVESSITEGTSNTVTGHQISTSVTSVNSSTPQTTTKDKLSETNVIQTTSDSLSPTATSTFNEPRPTDNNTALVMNDTQPDIEGGSKYDVSHKTKQTKSHTSDEDNRNIHLRADSPSKHPAKDEKLPKSKTPVQKKLANKSLKIHKSETGQSAENGDANSANTTSLRKSISQQDIIKAALTADTFKSDFAKNNAFSSSSGGGDGNKPGDRRSGTPVAAEDKALKGRGHRAAAAERNQAGPETTADSAADTISQHKTAETRQRRENKAAAAQHPRADDTSGESFHRRDQRYYEAADDTDTTTWNLQVHVDDEEDGDSRSYYSTASRSRRVPYEDIKRTGNGAVNISLGEREVDDLGSHQTDGQLRIDIDESGGYTRHAASSTVRGGLLVIDKSEHSSRVTSPAGRSRSSSMNRAYVLGSSSSRDRSLSPPEFTNGPRSRHYFREERVHHHQRPRHLSPPAAGYLRVPSPAYFNPIHPGRQHRPRSRSASRSRHGSHPHISLEPLSVDVSQGSHELRTHPTLLSPGRMASPAAVHSDLGGYTPPHMHSTLNRSQRGSGGGVYANPRQVLNSPRDINMNSLKPTTPRYMNGTESSRGRAQQQQPAKRSVSSRHVSNVSYSGGDSGMLYDTLDGGDSGIYRVQRVMDKRRLANQMAVPLDMHPDVAYKKQKFYSVSRERVHQQQQPRVNKIVSADPQLQDANKTGDRYNVTLKLNAAQLSTGGGGATVETERETREEYEERLRAKREQAMLRAQHFRSMSSPAPVPPPPEYPGRYVATAELTALEAAPVVEHLSFKKYHGAARVAEPVVRSRSSESSRNYRIRTDIDPVSAQQQQPRQRAPPGGNGGEAPRFTMAIDQTMKMDYVPPEDDAVSVDEPISAAAARQPANAARPPRGRRPVDEDMIERDQHRGNHGGYPNGGGGYPEMEDYFSPDEDEPYEVDNGGGVPQVVRGSILIKNAIDTAGAPRVFDVVDGGGDSDYDEDPVIEDNSNMFHNQYHVSSKENPLYSSDPDLSKLGRGEPAFTKLFAQKTSKAERKQPRRFMENDGDVEIPVESETYHTYQSNRTKTSSSGPPKRKNATNISSSRSTEFEVSSLLRNAPPDSIKQTINVEREEEEILGPLPENEDGSDPNAMLNMDTVSEKVDLGLEDGVAQVAVKVRCERIVPIRGVDDIYKKSSVIVTRLIEIDLTATEERRQLYNQVLRNSGQQMITDSSGKKRSLGLKKLSTKQTFNLYKTFMGLAEADEQGKSEHIQIDRKVEENRMPQMNNELFMNGNEEAFDELDENDHDIDALEQRLENQMLNYSRMRNPEPDTMSYMSAASETHDILY